MTVGEIKAYVASLVDDLQYAYFTETELLRFINQAQQETQKKLVLAGNNWYVKIDQTQSTVVNQANYTLPTDFLKMNRLELVNNPGNNEDRYSLKSITLNQKDMGFQASDSVGFYLLKNILYLNPKPQNIRTIRMYYTYRIAAVVLDADIPDVPPEFHEYLAYLVALKCFQKDGRDPNFILQQTKVWEDNLEAEAIERNQDHASCVVVVDEDVTVY